MKVKVISRSTDEFTRERSQDLQVSSFSLSLSLKIPNFLYQLIKFFKTQLLNFFFVSVDLTKKTQFWIGWWTQRVSIKIPNFVLIDLSESNPLFFCLGFYSFFNFFSISLLKTSFVLLFFSLGFGLESVSQFWSESKNTREGGGVPEGT